jgi:hypothetical protein
MFASAVTVLVIITGAMERGIVPGHHIISIFARVNLELDKLIILMYDVHPIQFQ